MFPVLGILEIPALSPIHSTVMIHSRDMLPMIVISTVGSMVVPGLPMVVVPTVGSMVVITVATMVYQEAYVIIRVSSGSFRIVQTQLTKIAPFRTRPQGIVETCGAIVLVGTHISVDARIPALESHSAPAPDVVKKIPLRHSPSPLTIQFFLPRFQFTATLSVLPNSTELS